jgi:TorA maturation chaperone TorD
VAVNPEMFRALGALCEPPDPAHARLAAALGLPPPPDAASYTDVFVFQLVPYAAPYLSPDAMLGGEAGDRVAGFWRALHLTPPAEPDHLAALTGLYAALADRETAASQPGAASEPGAAGAWREARRALLWEHLLTWVPAYTHAMSVYPYGFHAAWARLLRAVLLAEARELEPPRSAPLHLRDMPELPGQGPDLLRALLAPARSGLLITRHDLMSAAAAAGLGARPGSREFTLRSVLASDPAAISGWLARHAARWAERHRADLPALKGIAEHWLARAQASTRVLQQLPQPA